MDTYANHIIATTNDTATDTESPVLRSLWREYESTVSTLKKRESRNDAALLMRLTLLMFDLGLYHPSAP